MSQSKNRQKNSEGNIEKKLGKRQEQQGHGVTSDLPAAFQRATNEATRRPADILKLQQTVGNQSVQRLLGTAVSKNVPAGTIQRHISEGLITRFRSATRRFDEASYRGADKYRATDRTLDEYASAASDAHNAALEMEQAHMAARGEGSSEEGGEAQTPQSGTTP
jgi:hypothetical protein